MASSELTKFSSGTAPISQAVGVDVAIITNPGKGRWRIWGSVRHTLADGCRLAIGPDTSPTVLFTIPAGPNAYAEFGPIVYDINNNTDDIIVELAVATGGADTACAVVYAQRDSAV
jgi:hypothetical protein